jgi:2-dehydro-3-deoxygluconokinase
MQTALRIPDQATSTSSRSAHSFTVSIRRRPFRKAATCNHPRVRWRFNTAQTFRTVSDCAPRGQRECAIPDRRADRGAVRAMGVTPFYKMFKHDGAWGPNMAAVYSDRGYGVRAPIVFYNRSNEAAAQLKPGDFDWTRIFGGGVRWFHSGGIFASLSETTPI